MWHKRITPVILPGSANLSDNRERNITISDKFTEIEIQDKFHELWQTWKLHG
jgi:hypothetical protein